MRVDKLRKVLSGLQEWDEECFPSQIDLDVVSYLTLLHIRDEKEEISVYADFPLTNAWYRASRILLNLTGKKDWNPKDVEDIKYWLSNIVCFVYGSKNPVFNNIPFTRNDYKPYLKQLIVLYARFIDKSNQEEMELVDFLLSDRQADMLVNLCKNIRVFNIYSLGVKEGIFPLLELNQDLMVIVDTLYKEGLIGNGYSVSHLYKVEDLDDWQLEYMLERGCSNLLQEAWFRGTVKIPSMYQGELNRLENERRLYTEVPTVYKAVELWDRLSHEERVILHNRFGRDEDKNINVLGLKVNPLNLALLESGVTYLGLFGKPSDY